MATRAQSATSDGADTTATFGATPTEGNLLVTIAMDRSGVSESSMTISGSGWTKRIGRDVSLGDSTYRRSLSVWTKLAGASEPTGITVSGGTFRVTIQEFSNEAGEDEFTFLEKADNDNGNTSDATSVATGTTASVSGTKFLVIGVACWKRGGVSNSQTGTFDSGLGSEINAPGASWAHARHVCSGFDGDDTATGTKSSTCTMSGTDTSNAGWITGIMVFSLQAAAAATSFVVDPYRTMRPLLVR